MQTFAGTFSTMRYCFLEVKRRLEKNFARILSAGYRFSLEEGELMSEEAPRRTVTLHDVAAAAGVSISTVSRVLDDRSPPSRSVSAERVRHAAEQLGYRRNIFASNLRRGATATIGVLVPRLSDAVMALLYESIEREAQKRGYFAVVATCGDDTVGAEKAADVLLDRSVEGLILTTARAEDPLALKLRGQGTPHVLAIRTDGISPSSTGDDVMGGYLAVRQLIDLGHTRIAVIAGPEFASSARDRVVGAQNALREAGLMSELELFRASGFGVEDGYLAGQSLFANPAGHPSAIFAANDNQAIGAIQAAGELGLLAGKDYSIIGYNDIPLSSRLVTPLTSVRTPFDQIAQNAVDMLVAWPSANRHVKSLPTLMPRATTSRLQK